MYCPKCSQQQASEQQRFCSRCGFPLNGVADLLASGGVLPISTEKRNRSPRFEGISQGVILMMLAIVLLPLVGIIPAPYHEALVFMLLLAGIMRTGYALVFQEGKAKRHSLESGAKNFQSAPAELAESNSGAALPPAHSIPASDYISPRKDKAETAEPLSVTENTTKLLNEQ
jgi:hypothetical protein